jgi:hypothetical protein
MLELGVGADLVRAAGWLFIIFSLLCLAGIAWLATKGWRYAVVAVLVLLAFGYPVVKEGLSKRAVETAYEAKYQKAKALFEERCKTAGEKIYRTVEDVGGVLLLNIRQDDRPGEADNPLWPDAALPHEHSGDSYIKNFLFFENHDDKRNERGFLTNRPSKLPGYAYVEVANGGNQLERYVMVGKEGDIEKTPISQSSARYAVSFVNPMNLEDREYWIAGTKITVTDTLTKEVLADYTAYSFETAFGSKAGGRQPWRFAKTCPSRVGWNGGSTRFFVDQILKPKQGK